jgi:hypothetical protein
MLPEPSQSPQSHPSSQSQPSPRPRPLPLAALALLILCAFAGPWLPVVDRPARWLGVPSLLLWSMGVVVLFVPALCWIEFGASGRARDGQEEGNERGGRG